MYHPYACAECGRGFGDRDEYLAHVHPLVFDDEGTVIPVRMHVQLPRERAVTRLARFLHRVLRTGR